MKKNFVTYVLIAAGVAAAIILLRKKNKGLKSSVFADSPIIQSEDQFIKEGADAPAQPSILETAGTLIKTIFPKKTAEQKTAIAQKRKAAKETRMVKRTTRKAKKEKIGDISLLY